MANALYYGDNLVVLREHIADESVDLIYLDPPFNSQATYNVLFKAPTGEHSKAQLAPARPPHRIRMPHRRESLSPRGSNPTYCSMVTVVHGLLGLLSAEPIS
jgi:hypothetical protein